MKKFKLKANCTFFAADIDDALLQLSNHFEELSEGDDSGLIDDGEMLITPIP